MFTVNSIERTKVKKKRSTMTHFVKSGNTMNDRFQRTDDVFQIDQVNIGTINILELDMKHKKTS